jgi:Asp-tRNA(Asn)/Glu-tRNA(Gln) amidotransferase A subunit family amidase
LARTVTDLAIALDVSVGYDSEDAVTSVLRDMPMPTFQASLDKNALRGARIGVFLPYFRDTDAEIADTVRSAIAAMRALGATVVDVPMAEFDTLMANTSVINLETKFDLIDYLRTVPNAPVKSLREILDRGLYDRQLEVRFRVIDTVLNADSEQHRTVLARQTALRARMERILDSLQLDAIAYPTVRQKPTLVGEVQNGGTCNLGAQSGLPSISVPAGFAGGRVGDLAPRSQDYILMAVCSGGKWLFNPPEDARIAGGDTLVLMTNPEGRRLMARQVGALVTV